jgi:anaphase-promoting complex subunit 1
MSIGMLFMGGGEYTFGNDTESIAALLCTCYPRFPTAVDDQRSHFQPLRHLWVLAAKPRCLVTRDVDTGELCKLAMNIQILGSNNDRDCMTVTTPALLPNQGRIIGLEVGKDSEYWPMFIQFEHAQWQHVLGRRSTIPVKRRCRRLVSILKLEN